MGLFSKEEAKQYEIDGKQLTCMFCSKDTFYTRQEQLHSPARTILTWSGRIAWLPVLRAAAAVICIGL